MTIAAMPATYEDVDRLGGTWELVHGELREKQMAHIELWMASRLNSIIDRWLEENPIGFVSTETLIACWPEEPNHARKPDVCFYRRESLPDGVPTRAKLTSPPELAVEVVSGNDEANELETKIQEYLTTGVRLIWIINPPTRTAPHCAG